MLQQKLTPQQALQKLKHYCAYQERSHYEAQEKLYAFGLYKKEVDTILVELIEENYLNEERFAIAFTGGKFRHKQWGKVKIAYELQQKRVSKFNIQLALKSIDMLDYEKTLAHLAETKWISLQNETIYTRKAKTTQFLLQKGFELQAIGKAIALLASNTTTI